MSAGDAALLAVAELVECHSGLRHDSAARLAALAHAVDGRCASGGEDRAGLLRRLRQDPAQLAALVEELAVGETHFFRNPPQMLALRRRVLPELVARAAAEGRAVTAWSAGCSTGEEAYSLAVLLAEASAGTPVTVRVTGTDLSERALAAARAGRYPDRSLSLAGEADRRRWFVAEPGGWRVREQLRSLVRFRQHNLVADAVPFPAGSVDLVLCRNVMIYFSRETVAALVARLHEVLAPGGYLLLGHAETLWQVSDAFRLVQVGDGFLYRRDGSGAGAADPAAADRPVSGAGRPAAAPAASGGRTDARAASRSGDTARPPADAGTVGLRPGSSAGPPADVADAAVTAGPRADRADAADAAGPRADRVDAADAADVADAADAAGRPWSAPEALVRAELAAGRYPAALAAATEMLRRSRGGREAARAHYLRALALLSEHRDGEALAALGASRRLDPGDGLAQFLRATVLDRTGRRKEAAAGYAAAAAALAGRPPQRDAPELDGRSPADLLEMCRRLGGTAPRAAVG